MRGCVVGAGPSGLFAAKYLADRNIPVIVYERDKNILGYYKYAIEKAVDFSKILNSKNIEIRLDSSHKKIDDKECDFYVLATGGKPRLLDVKGGCNAQVAVEVIRDLKDGRNLNLGSNICIIGIGNVALDLLWWLKNKCKNVTVLCRSSPGDSSFDNYVLRKLLEGGGWEAESDEMVSSTGKRGRRRAELFEKYLNKPRKECGELDAKPAVKFLFNRRLRELNPVNGKIEVTYEDKHGMHREVFDSVVNSIGFIPNEVTINTSKPVFSTGWCVDANGNVGDAMESARACVESILLLHDASSADSSSKYSNKT